MLKNQLSKAIIIATICTLFLLIPATVNGQSKTLLQKAVNTYTLETGEKLLTEWSKIKDSHRYLYMGILSHNLSASGNPAYLSKAVSFLRKSLDTAPTALGQGYYGSMLTLEAGELFQKGDMANCMAKLNDGLNQIDKAVAKAPQDIMLRVLRIGNSYAISNASPVNRWQLIKEDLMVLKKNYKKLSKPNRSFFNLYSGLAAVKTSNKTKALGFFEAAIKAAPQSPTAQEARKQLASLEK